MAVSIVHASISENGNAGWDGRAKPGDQTGKEVCTRSYYKGGVWNCVLRYPDATIREKAKIIAVKLANSNLVGYDQSNRNSLYKALKRNGWNVDAYISSKEKTETDCSAFMYAVFCCLVPSMRSDDNAPVTSNMKSRYASYGFNVLIDTKYTKNSDYNMIGDVLVHAGHHTVMIIANGAKVGGIGYTGQLPTIPSRGWFQNGDSSNQVKVLKEFLNWYGGYGLDVNNPNYLDYTEACVKRFERSVGLVEDGEFGKLCLAKAKEVTK